jgi:hypothetical protein
MALQCRRQPSSRHILLRSNFYKARVRVTVSSNVNDRDRVEKTRRCMKLVVSFGQSDFFLVYRNYLWDAVEFMKSEKVRGHVIFECVRRHWVEA